MAVGRGWREEVRRGGSESLSILRIKGKAERQVNPLFLRGGTNLKEIWRPQSPKKTSLLLLPSCW